MSKTTGTKQGHIVQVSWPDGRREYYSSIAALVVREGEHLGVQGNTIKCNLSRKGVYESKRVRVEYVQIWIAVRGPRE